MPSMKQETEHLAQIERAIADGVARIARMEATVAEFQLHGRSTALLKETLHRMRNTLAQYVEVRSLIVEIIAAIKDGTLSSSDLPRRP